MRSNKGGIKTWLIFIVIIAIIFAGLFYLKARYMPSDEAEVTSEEEKPSKGFAKLPELTEEQKAEIDNDNLNTAMSTGLIEDCEKITYDEELKQECYDNINYAKILKTGDETQCEMLYDEDLKLQCYDKIYFSAAMDNFDQSLCEKISNEALKNNCINQIKVVMGRSATSEADCDSISDNALKQECLDNYYFSSSLDTLSEESCENITDGLLQSRCKKTVAQNIQVIELSEQRADEEPKTTEEALADCVNDECRNEANYDLAFEKKDLTYCNNISDSQKAEECIQEQSENLDQYYLRQAVARRDESMCSKINNTSLQELCMNSI